ncbi:MAG TPA: tetratricopeptide repeat protein, partial [Blastocatellia bacterium]|nr:tetratricopeptide repeat protein [Blastocatellia bacterium]
AEHYLVRAVELQPQDVSHRLQLGRLYRSQGQLPQAEQQLRIALKLNPYHQDVISELREISTLKKSEPPSSNGGRRPNKPLSFIARIFRRSYSA